MSYRRELISCPRHPTSNRRSKTPPRDVPLPRPADIPSWPATDGLDAVCRSHGPRMSNGGRVISSGGRRVERVVYGLLFQVQVHKYRDGNSLTILVSVDKVGGYNVECWGIALELGLENLRWTAEMTQLKCKVSYLFPVNLEIANFDFLNCSWSEFEGGMMGFWL